MIFITLINKVSFSEFYLSLLKFARIKWKKGFDPFSTSFHRNQAIHFEKIFDSKTNQFLWVSQIFYIFVILEVTAIVECTSWN